MDEDTVEPQVQDQAVIDSAQDQLEANIQSEAVEMQEKQVPLSALQKERRKRQELELELQFEREQKQKAVQPEANMSQLQGRILERQLMKF
jgi:hypothetical protein